MNAFETVVPKGAEVKASPVKLKPGYFLNTNGRVVKDKPTKGPLDLAITPKRTLEDRIADELRFGRIECWKNRGSAIFRRY